MYKKAYWIGLTRVNGLGPKRFQLLLKKFGDPETVWKAGENSLAEVLGAHSPVLKNLLECRDSLDLTKEITMLERNEVRVLTLADPEYPVRLLNIHDPPPVLYLRGSLPGPDAKTMAVVGSRRATPYGKAVAEQLGYDLTVNGFVVVSGLARGIDTCAHRGALKAKGPTIAVLGCGVDIVYPRENKGIFQEIIENGAIISEFPLGTPPEARNFPARNRIISGLSLGVVVVEAAEDGGALITADFALEQGRDVFAVPGPITSRYSRGTNRLIKEGARLIEGVADIIEEYPLVGGCLPSKPTEQLSWPVEEPLTNRIALSEEERVLVELLSLDPVAVDHLIAVSGLTASRVNSILMFLEMKGLVRQLPGRRYIRAGKISF